MLRITSAVGASTITVDIGHYPDKQYAPHLYVAPDSVRTPNTS